MERTIDMDKVAQLLRLLHIPAVVEMTGGGVATLYVGPPDIQDQYPVVMGPGWFEGPGYTKARGSAEELWVGPDTTAYEMGLPSAALPEWGWVVGEKTESQLAAGITKELLDRYGLEAVVQWSNAFVAQRRATESRALVMKWVEEHGEEIIDDDEEQEVD